MKFYSFFSLFLYTIIFCFGQQRGTFVPNYDESKVPEYEIPDPLTSFNGRKIKNTRLWEKIRRPELMEFFTSNVYGKIPAQLHISNWEVIEESNQALNGKAQRKQVNIIFNKNGKTLIFNVLLYLPKNVEKAPVFLGYNFNGNHTVCNDTNILISSSFIKDNGALKTTKKPRGSSIKSWQVEKLIDSGYGLATIFYGEIDPDKNDFTDGIHALFYNNNQHQPAAGEWGSIAAWAWGLSRTMDYMEQDDDVDETKVIVFGHSRLGKTALWAGANDKRFAAVISNNSGCGGAALSKRQFGETVARINSSFPHWFTRNFSIYNKNENILPVDQHELIALIAPRPVYIASAEEDKWADPRGEFLSAYHATLVYELYGKAGISSAEMPPINQPIQNTVAYHIRNGRHAVTSYDWDQYINWANIQVLNKTGYKPKTYVSIRNEKFYINGKPTFEGRTWHEISVEGLLPNSRMVNGIFDDLNRETEIKWKYPDTGRWDPERNTREFTDAMPEWRKHGLLAFTINFQGGSPEGYSTSQPWENNAFEADGTLRSAFSSRMERIIKKADGLGMVVILGIFYFGQDERLENENAVINAVDNVVQWILNNNFKNVIIEVANESNHKAYDHDIIKNRVHELILRIKEKTPELLVSTSFGGGFIPPDKVVEVSDFVLIHGNGVNKPEDITKMVETVRSLPSYRSMPIIFNEDDHFQFEQPVNNFVNATQAYASWGFFDYRMKNEHFNEGYQSIPVNWAISSNRKRDFFNKIKEIFID